jgi:hypothetical protein
MLGRHLGRQISCQNLTRKKTFAEIKNGKQKKTKEKIVAEIKN